MRRPRSVEQPVVHRHRTAAPGRHTVYLVHPGALDASVHRGLAEALPAGVGLTVLDLGGLPEYWQAALTGGHAATTIDALASRLLTAVQVAHIEGDYVLAGWSFGGVVAHAMAGLPARHGRPTRLVLLDSIAPVEDYKHDDDALEPSLLLGWFTMYLGAKRGRPLHLGAERLAGLGVDDGLKLVLEAAVAAEVLLPSTSLPGLRKLYDTYVDGLLRNNRLTNPHQPLPAPVPVVLVKAERSLIPEDRTLGWEPLAPHGLEVHTCPGDHYTMLTRADAASVVASLLDAA
ncbi:MULTISPECIES: thioesterase domain-containing protein [Streptomyces]|uniref:thioesterase domain-containing protein n=1 Tax=Streptomyces TaxID=1883 RepID=UPI001CA65B4F|nr:thioesterase domain-containing protein [Streptomyces sennicomposti]MBY8870147.1 thioesterase [Streptomyces sennicomposti]